jgi:hypothetical protein
LGSWPGSPNSLNAFQRSKKLIIVFEIPPFIIDFQKPGCLRIEGIGGLRLSDLKEALNISGLDDFHSIGFPDGREEHGLGDLLEQLEEVISHGAGILSLPLSFLKEEMKGGIHLIDQLIDSLGFELGRHPKETLPMGWEFDLSVSVKNSRMISNPVPLDQDLKMIWIGKDLTRPVGIGRRDRVAIGLKFDKPGFGDGGQDDPVGTIGDCRKGFEFFFLQGLHGVLPCSPMDSLIPLDPPEAQLPV